MDVFSGLSPLVVAGGGGHFGGGRGQSAPRSGLLVAAGLGAGLPDPTDSVAGPGTCGSWLGCGLVAAARPGGHLAGLRGFACGRVGRPVVAGAWHGVWLAPWRPPGLCGGPHGGGGRAGGFPGASLAVIWLSPCGAGLVGVLYGL